MTFLSSPAAKSLRLGLLLLACTSTTAFLTAATSWNSAPTVAELTAGREVTSRTTIWLVFRAPDCGISAELIAHLNSLDASDRVSVVGVMLFSPADSATRRGLRDALGIQFAVEYDENGEWRAAFNRERTREPALIVRDGVSLLGSVSPHFMREFKALALSEIPMERER